jgi:imidazolonepropionase-like amidohydrolase
MRWCKHEWQLIKETYQPSGFEILRDAGVDMAGMEVLPTFFDSHTNLVFQCANCSKLQIEHLQGKSVLPKEEK